MKIYNFEEFIVESLVVSSSMDKFFENYLSDDENKSLKLIYKFIRDILLDFKLRVSIYFQKNPGNVSISDFIKSHYKPYKNITISKEAPILLIDFNLIDPIIKKTFKSLQDKFWIRFKVKDEGAAIISNTSGICGLEIGTTKLFNYPVEALKSSLQHEIQHIANLSKEKHTGYGEGNLNYLASKVEVDSHAKQFAYIYSKKYPNDITIDGNKLRNLDMVERSKNKLNIYLWFMSPDEFRKIHKMSDETYELVKQAGKEFPQKLKYYLSLFNKK
jgi:hypothetical protein